MFNPLVDRTDISTKAEQNTFRRLCPNAQFVNLCLKIVEAFVHPLEVVADQPKLFQHKAIYIFRHDQPPIAQRAQRPPKTSNFARNATRTTQPSDRGRNTFQPIRINWS